MCCSVHGSVCLVWYLFDSVCELFGETIAMCLGVVAILLLNVMFLCDNRQSILLSYNCY